VRHILDEGMRGAQELQQQQACTGSSSSRQPGSPQWPLMYSWHNKRYLGAAHGEDSGRVSSPEGAMGGMTVISYAVLVYHARAGRGGWDQGGGGMRALGRCAAHGDSMRSAYQCSFGSVGRGRVASFIYVQWALMHSWHDKCYLGAAHGETIHVDAYEYICALLCRHWGECFCVC
jgi:hypothetical protein